MATDYQEAIRILSEQEKILQFDSFTSEDAWKLGNIMVEEIRNQGDQSYCQHSQNEWTYRICICIRGCKSESPELDRP